MIFYMNINAFYFNNDIIDWVEDDHGPYGNLPWIWLITDVVTYGPVTGVKQ